MKDVDSGKLDIVEILISYGTDICTLDDQGQSLLHEALRIRKIRCCGISVQGRRGREDPERVRVDPAS
jgi:hypothetical protein